MQKRTVSFSQHSSNLFFHILTKCNLSCNHCYINKEQHGDNTLDLETIKNWLTLFAKNQKNCNLIFLGGEPTLHPDLGPAVKFAKRLDFQSITIDTNGYLFHNILDKISKDDIDFLSFSLDGATKNTNDSIRGEGSFDTVIKNIKNACEKKFSCSMIYTVSESNFHELKLMPRLIKSLGIKRFFIQVIGIRGESVKADQQNQVSKQKWLNSIPIVAEQIARLGIIVTYPIVFLENHQPFQCAANVSNNYFVFPNGRVYQCPLCEDFPIHGLEIQNNELIKTRPINETDFFKLDISEGCVMNKIVQPGNLDYDDSGNPSYKIACCML